MNINIYLSGFNVYNGYISHKHFVNYCYGSVWMNSQCKTNTGMLRVQTDFISSVTLSQAELSLLVWLGQWTFRLSIFLVYDKYDSPASAAITTKSRPMMLKCHILGRVGTDVVLSSIRSVVSRCQRFCSQRVHVQAQYPQILHDSEDVQVVVLVDLVFYCLFRW